MSKLIKTITLLPLFLFGAEQMADSAASMVKPQMKFPSDKDVYKVMSISGEEVITLPLGSSGNELFQEVNKKGIDEYQICAGPKLITPETTAAELLRLGESANYTLTLVKTKKEWFICPKGPNPFSEVDSKELDRLIKTMKDKELPISLQEVFTPIEVKHGTDMGGHAVILHFRSELRKYLSKNPERSISEESMKQVPRIVLLVPGSDIWRNFSVPRFPDEACSIIQFFIQEVVRPSPFQEVVRPSPYTDFLDISQIFKVASILNCFALVVSDGTGYREIFFQLHDISAPSD